MFCFLIILEGQLTVFAGEPAIRSVHFLCPGVPLSACSARFENVVLIRIPITHRGKAGPRAASACFKAAEQINKASKTRI